MNWMTSAKKRMSKATKLKPDQYKRLNAFKKLNKIHRVNILKINDKPKHNESYDWRMIANISQDNHAPDMPDERAESCSKDPFVSLDLSSEDEEELFKEETLWASNQTSADKSMSTKELSKETTIMNSCRIKETNAEPIEKTEEILSTLRSPPSQLPQTAETKEKNAIHIAHLWELFEGDSRCLRSTNSQHYMAPEIHQDPNRTDDKARKLNFESNRISHPNIFTFPNDNPDSTGYTVPFSSKKEDDDELEVSDFV